MNEPIAGHAQAPYYALVMVPAWILTLALLEKPSDLVDVTTVIPDAVLDIRYATEKNFTGKAVYPVATCKLRRAVATRLAKAAATLRKHDRRLLIWDCYRPKSIQDVFWKLVPDERYVADPKKGSRHSRGAAVDVGVVDKDGNAVTLPTAFDDFSEAAHREHALDGERGVEARRLESGDEGRRLRRRCRPSGGTSMRPTRRSFRSPTSRCSYASA